MKYSCPFEIAEGTHPGGREVNQDASGWVTVGDRALLVTADGLGGHDAGDLAARHFCLALIAEGKPLLGERKSWSAEDFERLLQRAIGTMRDAIADPELEAYTTAAVALLTPKRLWIGHIGDSRIYRLKPDDVCWRTRDDSLIQLLRDQGKITEAEMSTHPLQNRLLKSIGMTGVVELTCRADVPLAADECLLLCSDGFWEVIEPAEMCSLCAATLLDDALADLIKTAVARGGSSGDNVTAQTVRLTSNR